MTSNVFEIRATRVLFLLIASLLLSTAAAKFWMLANDPFAAVRIGISREILMLSGLFEIVVAGANLFLANRSRVVLINVATFALFGIFATARWLMGYSHCGCSGNIEIHPLIFIVIDWGIVAWFISGGFGISTSPSKAVLMLRNELVSQWRALSRNARRLWIGICVFVFGLSLLQLPFSQAVWTAITGSQLIEAVVTIDGELHLNQEQAGRVTITNRSNQAAKVFGVDRSCRCFELANDPVGLVLPAREQITVPLIIKPNRVGPIHQQITLFVEKSDQFRVPIILSASLKEGE